MNNTILINNSISETQYSKKTVTPENKRLSNHFSVISNQKYPFFFNNLVIYFHNNVFLSASPH